jgi:hypothetical protein
LQLVLCCKTPLVLCLVLCGKTPKVFGAKIPCKTPKVFCKVFWCYLPQVFRGKLPCKIPKVFCKVFRLVFWTKIGHIILCTMVTNIYPNSTLEVWANHSYNKQNGTFKGYWYVSYLEGNGCTLRGPGIYQQPKEKELVEGS